MSVMDLLTHPAFGYGLLALAIGLCTFLFITLKQDLHRVHTSHARAEKHLEGLVDNVTLELSSLRKSVHDVEIKASALPQMADPRPGMNVSRRGQVLRMHKRGERPEQIATALGLPLNEVELLLKVSRAPLGHSISTFVAAGSLPSPNVSARSLCEQ